MGISFDFFYSDLSPHGRWLVSGSYGRVWQPADYRAGWNPYSDGHWVYTDVGWTWLSDYEWGAVPYHYGTWVLDMDVGWVWVPGYVWAPAWVVFRTGPDYIGWAPVPVGYSVGGSIGSASYSPDLFLFVASRDFLAPRVGAYAVPAARTRVIINNTRIENTIRVENNVVVNTGPDVRLVQRASGRTIEAESIERVPRVGPARHMSRDDLRVDAVKSGTGLRAAEPISERQSRAIIEGRGRDESRAPRAGERTPRPETRPPRDEGDRIKDRSGAQADDGVKADDKARADAKARDDAKAKADAKADARRKGNPKKKEKPKPTPADDKPPSR
ncbi:MAG TPA: DUF6600 domain-containing protein [Candidatus Dormibacteraeota bacterium]|nr:DUF6600 domain-containing protein [Candidatus Dormibacteraeota bacterium]